jgi:O-antigen/teichoic acid export membrane protein
MVIMAVTGLAATVCGLGAGEGIARRTARNRADFPQMLGHGLMLIAATGAVLVLLCTAVLALIGRGWGDAAGPGVLLALALANTPLFALVSFYEKALIGQEAYARANVVNLGFALVRLAAAAGATLAAGVVSIAGWAPWALGAHVLAAIGAWLLVRRYGAPVFGLERKELGLGLNFSTPLLIDAVRQNADRVVLGMVASPAIVGAYAAAGRMAQIAQIGVNSVNRIMYPRLVREAAKSEKAAWAFVLRYAGVVLAISTVAAGCVFIAAPWMPVLLGPSYAGVIRDLQILCWLVIPLGLLTAPYDALGAADRHKLRAAVYNPVSLLATALLAGLIFQFGREGAFIGVYLAAGLLCASMWAVLYRSRA